MRTKESAEFEQQESTWIYLLHQQAPPQTRLSAEAALTLPPLASSSPAMGSSPLFADRASTYSTSDASNFGLGVHTEAANAASSRYVLASRVGDDGAALLSKQPRQQQQPQPQLQPSSMMMSAQDKRWSAAPSLRPMLERYESVSQSHYYPAAELAGARSALEKYQTRQRQDQQQCAAGGLLELLPSKRARLDQMPNPRELSQQVSVAPRSSTPTSAPSPSSSHSSSKRNCFPKKCDFPMCKNSSRSRGFCYSHGGGRRCRMDGCSNGAVSRDLCKRHGGGRRCRIVGCKSSSESGGLCYSHGGGRRCSLSWCSARAKKGGFCAVHLTDKSDASRPAAAQHKKTPVNRKNSNASVEAQADGSAHTNVVETLLSLAKNASSGSDDAGVTDSSSPSTSPSGSGNSSSSSAYALASILN